MKRLLIILLTLLCACSNYESNKKHSQKIKSEASESPIDIISFHYGYLESERLKLFGVPFNLEQVIAGMRSARKGQASPYSDEMIKTAYAQLDEDCSDKQKKENLELAEQFLTEISKKPRIIELLPKKLYYETLVNGPGAIIQETALIEGSFRVMVLEKTGKEKLIESLSQEKAQISIPDTIPGFAKGLSNMQIGEKRKIYIHPELAYGTYGGKFESNQLIIIEIEIFQVISNQSDIYTKRKI